MLIEWDTGTTFENLTRNGFSKSAGIAVNVIAAEIHLESVSSKGIVGKARIVVPLDQVDALIGALRMQQTLAGRVRLYANDPVGTDDEAIMPDGSVRPWDESLAETEAVRVRPA